MTMKKPDNVIYISEWIAKHIERQKLLAAEIRRTAS